MFLYMFLHMVQDQQGESSFTPCYFLAPAACIRRLMCLIVGTCCSLNGMLVTNQHRAWFQVTRMRTAVHGEVVRALQRLTALPLSGPLLQSGSKKSNGSSTAVGGSQNSNGNHALGMPPAKAASSPRPLRRPPVACGGVNGTSSNLHVADATSPRKRPVLPPQSVSNGTSAPPSDGAAHSSEAVSNGKPKDGKEGSLSAVIFMDKSSARAHADAITSHTFKAFQRVCSSICSWPNVKLTIACALVFHPILRELYPPENCAVVVQV